MRSVLLLCALALPACATPEPPPPTVVYALPDDLVIVCHEGEYAVISPSLMQGRIFNMKCI